MFRSLKSAETCRLAWIVPNYVFVRVVEGVCDAEEQYILIKNSGQSGWADNLKCESLTYRCSTLLLLFNNHWSFSYTHYVYRSCLNDNTLAPGYTGLDDTSHHWRVSGLIHNFRYDCCLWDWYEIFLLHQGLKHCVTGQCRMAGQDSVSPAWVTSSIVVFCTVIFSWAVLASYHSWVML